MSIITPSDDDETRQFYQQLCQYEDHVLRMTFEYFQDDLLYIVENMSLLSLLHELSSRKIRDVEKYLSLENDRRTLARTLLQDVFLRRRKDVIGLWVSLYALRRHHGSAGLDTVLEELHHRGKTLVEEILLDELGHQLLPQLKDFQNRHKKHLCEKTEKLLENKPPRCDLREERFPFSTRYVNLIIVSTHHFRKRSVNELIETGVKHDEYLKKRHNELQHISPNKLFRWCHRSRLVPRVVMVSGVPGVGKTTLMQKVVYDWVRGDLYQRFSFIFFFKFRELNRLDKVSLETMILLQYPYLEELLGSILQDPEKLLFIFDGLDESLHNLDFTSRPLCSNPQQPEPCGQIVVSLVRKSLLNGCSLLITSRPTRLASIDCGVFQRIVEITGFLPEERQIYFEHFFPDQELAEKAFNYVKQNDALYTFCYLPSYCWILCTVLSKSFQPTSSDQPASLLPKTVTQLFAIFVANILSNHSLHKSDALKILQSIGWMAEHGVMNHRIIFDERDLDCFHVDNKSKLLSSFLMESEEPVSYSFLHLTVQEFFSALVHYTDYSPEKLQKSLIVAKSYPDGRGEIFLRFLCGLSDGSTRSMLSGYLDRQAAQTSIDVITQLKNFILEEQRPIVNKKNKRRLLSTFFYLYESRNKPLVLESLQSLRSLDFSHVHMSALDCTVLAFILDTCTHIEELILHNCFLDTEGLEKLAPALHNLQNLSLVGNNLQNTSCIQLASLIRNNQSLKILDLSGNSLSGPHLSDLMEALCSPACRIEELHLDGNHLRDTSCIQLASVLRNNQSLKRLVLSNNSLSGRHLSDLMEALSIPACRIEELLLAHNNLPDTSCIQLASVIRNNQSLKRLDLSGNRLSGPHLSDLMEALSSPACRIEELHLGNNDLPDTSCIQLASVIRNNQSLKRLDLSGNRLSGPHLSDLMEALSSPACRIEELRGFYDLPGMSIISPSDDDGTRQFYQQLCQYKDHVLRVTYEYFQDDLLHIVENFSTNALLIELRSRNIPDVEKYLSLEYDRRRLARTLLQDIILRRREDVIGLWVSLYVLQKDHGSPGLDAVLEELRHRGKTLVEEILLDECGHQLSPQLKDFQNRHKKHLYEETEKLLENKPPRCDQREEHFPFSTRYVNLIIVSTDHFRERSENELIETGVKHEEYLKKKHNELQSISPNKLFRWCHRSRLVPRMVMVSGVPGVGKTTLMQKVVYDWIKGDFYQRFSFVFFFKFRELNRLDKVSLETMILHQYPYLEEQLRDILQDPEKLLFIFDGLDESLHNLDFTSRHLCSHPKQPEPCGQIVVSLVRKSLLNGCSLLMTSRLTRLASINCGFFQRIVEITGFLPEERQIYFEHFFPDQELAEKAFNYVKQNDALYTFCYLPSYCWILCTVLSKSFQPTSSDQPASLLPKTVTQLFAIFVANILSNHSLHKSDALKILQSIGWMAEHGVMNHRIIFDERDLDCFHVDNKSKLLSSFLMESEEPVSYSFLHLTVQEFFSALVHYTDYSPEKLQKSLKDAKSYPDGRGEIFLRFLCGLSDGSTRSMLSGYLDKQAAQTSIDVITWLKNFILEEQRLIVNKKDKQRLLRTFFYLYESRNKTLVLESLQSLRSLHFSDVRMSALDCTVLAFILDTCTNIEELDLYGCSLDTEGLEILAPALHNLQNLSLSDNNLPDTSCIQLASVIRNNQSLKILVLSLNSLSGPHLSDLMGALSSPACRIEELRLSHNDLLDTSCIQLASVIRNNQSLKRLVLSGNSLSGPHLRDLMEALSSPACRIEELRMLNNGLSEEEKEALRDLRSHKPNMKIHC